MPKVDGEALQQSKDRVYLTLRRYPMGLKESELANIMGLERRTLHNYLKALDTEGKIYKEEGTTLWIALPFDQAQLRKFELSPEEAMTLYLAARLFVKQNDKQNEPAQTALMKLAAALVGDAKVGNEIHQAALELSRRPDDGAYNRVFRTIMQAYIYRRVVHIEYQPASGRAFLTDFEPYLLEPSAIGFTTYAIGKSSIVNDLRTYKLERIRSAALTRQEYSIPNNFPGLEILRNAWSIIHGDELVAVSLRFSPAVRERVLETRWHFSEKKQDDPEHPGHLLWQAQVADTIDMLPWIRGWGSDCEVLEPKELRNALMREARGLVELYKVMEVKKELFAHFREKDKDYKTPQYLWEHLTDASKLAGQFASKIGLQKSGEILGLLHDLGKASKEFQKYLLSGEGLLNPDSDDYIDHAAMKGKIDHSTAGAQIIYNRLWSKGSEERLAAQVLCLAIASHHSGLINCLLPSGEDNFTRRMNKTEANAHADEAFTNLAEHEKITINELLADETLINQLIGKFKSLKEENDSQDTVTFKYGLLIRFLLSCLLDADRLNTADFEFPGNARLRNNNVYPSWETLIERLNSKISEFENKVDRNDVDDLRSQVSQSCLDFSSKPKGIYQLTVPTGGGKTFASLRFALNHAAHHSKTDGKIDRIFYVIPYTSIIDQNAEEARKVLEDKDKNGNYLNKVVLEHHSNLTPDEETRRQNLLAENWDAPIVFTTQVQFLEALFGSGTRSARGMHQLANSVIIFDEIQTIPIRCVHMFNLAIRFLVHSCGATVVLCTATQPLLDKVAPIQRALKIQPEQKIIPYVKELFKKLKRVEVFDRRKIGGWSDEEVAGLAIQELREKGSVLIVVNTKKSARSLYQAVVQKSDLVPYHLSTNMCPAHRLEILSEIKEKLKNEEPVICVSTQLIEAGVDIDFGAVIRYLAGMDSIAQAAGRCNRNGVRKSLGNVWVVNPSEESLDKLRDIKIGKEKAERILGEFKDAPESFENDMIGLKTMETYYQYYFYDRKDEMSYKVSADSPIGRADDLFNLLSMNKISEQEHERINQAAPNLSFKQSFQSASKAFRVIDSFTQGVVVPYGKEGEEIINDLCGAFDLERQHGLIKKAQRYSVNLFPYEFKKMADNKAIREVQEGAGVFYLDKQYYSEKFGWSDDPVNGMETLIK